MVTKAIDTTRRCMVKTAKHIKDGEKEHLEIKLALIYQKTGDFSQYYNDYKCWDVGLLAHLETMPNTQHMLIFHPDRPKKDKQDDGEWASYWWSIVGEVEIPVGEEAVIPASTPADAPKRPVQRSNGSATSFDYLDNETATNRRTALMQAREAVDHLCIYGGSLAKDDTGRLTDYMDTVVQLADRFYGWLQGQPAITISDAATSQDMASSDESEFDQEFPPQGQAPSPAPATPAGTRPKCAACNVFLARGQDGTWVHRLRDGTYHNALGEPV